MIGIVAEPDLHLPVLEPCPELGLLPAVESHVRPRVQGQEQRADLEPCVTAVARDHPLVELHGMLSALGHCGAVHLDDVLLGLHSRGPRIGQRRRRLRGRGRATTATGHEHAGHRDRNREAPSVKLMSHLSSPPHVTRRKTVDGAQPPCRAQSVRSAWTCTP
jgi:hypothetical protein